MKARLLLHAVMLCALTACDPQGDCVHDYGTPDVTFACRGGAYSVTCVGVDPAAPARAPYQCTCTSPAGAGATFPLAQELWTYNPDPSVENSFEQAYATVNTNCHWNLSGR